jgi:hypothetical protein
VMAALAFGLAIYHIVTIWRNHKKED